MQASAAATTLPPGFDEATLTEGVFIPTAVDWAPDGTLFVAEKQGRVFAAPPGGEVGREPILDITHRVNDRGERGLLDIAVDADFEINRQLYLLYTVEVDPAAATTPAARDTDGPVTSRLTRVTIEPDGSVENWLNPDEEVVLGKESTSSLAGCPNPDPDRDCIPADYIWHTIGTVISAPDGTLWVGSGDAHAPGVIDGTSFRTFNPNSLSGKIMHIDRDGDGLPGHPYCPGETDLTKTCTKVHAVGFRNPFRFSLGPDGNPIVGDVGWGDWEEVDFVAPGENHGWPCYEGDERQPAYESAPECQALYAKEGTSGAAKTPDWSYSHQGGGASIEVGPLYPGGAYPSEYDGKVFIADYAKGWVKLLDLKPDGSFEDVEPFAEGWPAGVDLELTPEGDLAYVDIGFSPDGTPGFGAVRRFTYAAANGQAVAVAEADVEEGPPDLTVNFDGTGSSDPEGSPLTYEWSFGDGSPPSSSPTPTHTYTQRGTYTARLTVDDGTGRRPTDRVRIRVGAPPTAEIETAPTTYRGGQELTFTGSADDTDEPPGMEAQLSWEVRLIHNDHAHPVADGTGPSFTFEATRDHDADSYYRVILEATDSNEQTGTAETVINPETTPLSLTSVPAGAPLSYDGGQPVPGPINRTAAVGFRTTIGAAPSFVSGGESYLFDSWSDGGTRQHNIEIPVADATFTALYERLETVIEGGPASGSSTGSASPSFAFSSEAGSAFECRMDSEPFSACSSPYASQPLADGAHTFEVRATNGSGVVDLSPASRTFTVDTAPPETRIDPGTSRLREGDVARFSLSSNEATASFECRLDDSPFAPCGREFASAPLNAGEHRFEARAIDTAGNLEADPAVHVFAVEAAPVRGGEMTLGEPRVDRRRGKARLPVTVTAPGTLTLRGDDVRRQERSALAPRSLSIPVAAARESAARLRDRGRAVVRFEVVYDPATGPKVVESGRIELVRRARGRD